MKHIESVDTIRLIAITAVIAIHTTPFYSWEKGSNLYLLSLFINELARFAVPFFFVISGFFWGLKIRSKTKTEGILATQIMVKRLLFLFLAWSAIYLLPFKIEIVFDHGLLGPLKGVYWSTLKALDNPINTLFQGTKLHLWFLSALTCSVLICSTFIIYKRYTLLILISLFLYITGVLAGPAYGTSPLGFNIGFSTRDGPFFGTLFFSTGYLLSGRLITKNWFSTGVIFSLTGFGLHLLESYYLVTRFNAPLNQDYFFGTYFFGVGVSLIALSGHRLLRNKSLETIGKMTLGIYAVHFMFVEILQPIGAVFQSVIWEISYILLVLMLSVITTYFLSKYRLTKRLVS